MEAERILHLRWEPPLANPPDRTTNCVAMRVDREEDALRDAFADGEMAQRVAGTYSQRADAEERETRCRVGVDKRDRAAGRDDGAAAGVDRRAKQPGAALTTTLRAPQSASPKLVQ
jgi:hypothetical protein